MDPNGRTKTSAISTVASARSGIPLAKNWPLYGDALDIPLAQALEEAQRWAKTTEGRVWLRRVADEEAALAMEKDSSLPKNLTAALVELREQGVRLSSVVLAHVDRVLAAEPGAKHKQYGTWLSNLRVWQRMDDSGLLDESVATGEDAADALAKDMSELHDVADAPNRPERNRRGQS